MADGAVGALLGSHSRFRGAVFTCAAAMMLAACGESTTTPSPPSIPKVSITADAHGFTIQPSSPLQAGLLEFDLRNSDARPHQFTFASPLGTTTLDQIRATVTSGQLDQLHNQVELGFSWGLPPGGAQTLYLTYHASTDFVVSLISMGPHALPEAARGYLAQFTVSGTQSTGQPQPSVAGTLTINTHSISVPTGFGKGTFAMVNMDAAGHRLTFFRFTGAAKPLADVIAAFDQPPATGPTPPSGPPPELTLGLQSLGGATPFPPYGCSCIMGSRVLGTFDLSPGTYVLLGDDYNPVTNKIEATEGLAAEFTVS
jgi:hypothetical protein